MNEKKRGRPWPRWALDLKNGYYTVDDIILISNAKRNSVQRFLKDHAKFVGIIEKRGKILKVYSWEHL